MRRNSGYLCLLEKARILRKADLWSTLLPGEKCNKYPSPCGTRALVGFRQISKFPSPHHLACGRGALFACSAFRCGQDGSPRFGGESQCFPNIDNSFQVCQFIASFRLFHRMDGHVRFFISTPCHWRFQFPNNGKNSSGRARDLCTQNNGQDDEQDNKNSNLPIPFMISLQFGFPWSFGEGNGVPENLNGAVKHVKCREQPCLYYSSELLASYVAKPCCAPIFGIINWTF